MEYLKEPPSVRNPDTTAAGEIELLEPRAGINDGEESNASRARVISMRAKECEETELTCYLRTRKFK